MDAGELQMLICGAGSACAAIPGSNGPAMCNPGATCKPASTTPPQASAYIPAYLPASPPPFEPHLLTERDTESMETHVVRTYNRRNSHSFNSSAYMDMNVRSRAPSPSSSGHADSEFREYQPCLDVFAARISARGLTAARRRDRSTCDVNGITAPHTCPGSPQSHQQMYKANPFQSFTKHRNGSDSGDCRKLECSGAVSEARLQGHMKRGTGVESRGRFRGRARAGADRRSTVG